MNPIDRLLESLNNHIEKEQDSLKQLKNTIVYTKNDSASDKINFRYLRFSKIKFTNPQSGEEID